MIAVCCWLLAVDCWPHLPHLPHFPRLPFSPSPPLPLSPLLFQRKVPPPSSKTRCCKEGIC